MKLYQVSIQPLSGWVTPFKGDSVFGHFCWQAAYRPDLIDGGLEAALQVYDRQPFAVFSSAVTKAAGAARRYILKRPDVPLHCFGREHLADRRTGFQQLKALKARKWVLVEDDLTIDLSRLQLLNEQDVIAAMGVNAEVTKADDISLNTRVMQPHNTINRLTGTTGGDPFAPYGVDQWLHPPGAELSIFVLVDLQWTDIDRIVSGLADIGRFGYGKDASTGKGRFRITDVAALALPVFDDTPYCCTLAPCVPVRQSMQQSFFEPFTRFGKHGDMLARSANPFKNPVIMADEGAVFKPHDKPTARAPYIGQALPGASSVQPTAMVQGYAPCIPVKMEASR